MNEITIVIPTHNRYQKLKALLDSIRIHRTPELDSIIAVDDSPTITDIESEFRDLSLKQISLSRRAFISKSKNIGWRAAKTDFVYFIDDDNVIDDTTIEPVYQAIRRSDRNGAVAPAVLYKSRPDLVWVYATPFLNSRLIHNLVGRNLPRNPSLEYRFLSTDALPNASLIRRSALEEIGGFDESLVVNSSMDLALRLKSKGWRVMADTGAFIYHDVEPPGEFGWWASHGASDPARVNHEIRDWFQIMRRLHGGETLFTLRTMVESSRFVLPNLLAYAVMGRERRKIVGNLLVGYAQALLGLVGTNHKSMP